MPNRIQATNAVPPDFQTSDGRSQNIRAQPWQRQLRGIRKHPDYEEGLGPEVGFYFAYWVEALRASRNRGSDNIGVSASN
jgi:hypothetical protein